MIYKWFKVKKMKLELKHKFYTIITAVLSEQDEIMEFFKNVYLVTKDVPLNELQDKLISAIAEYAHEEAVKESQSE